MENVLAIIPARAGSKGIPFKNWMWLAGMTPVERAVHAAVEAGIPEIATATDVVISPSLLSSWTRPVSAPVTLRWIYAGPPLHTDTCLMRDVVADVLTRVPGPEEQRIILLQPTQPLRTPAHVQAAIALLEAGARCVVSVTPATSPDKLWKQDLHAGGMYPWDDTSVEERRQDARAAFKADGTVYAWRRRDGYWDWPFTPLLIPQDETCPLDSPADWAEAARRLRDRSGHTP